MTKVMFAIPELGHGGPDRVVAAVASGLAARGWSVVVAVQRAGGVREAGLPSSVRVVAVRSGRHGVFSRQPVLGLRAVLRQEQPDVLISTLRMVSTAAVATRALRPRPRVVARPANDLDSTTRELSALGLKYRFAFALARWSLRVADGVIAQSPDILRSARRAGFDGPSIIIENPVPETVSLELVRLDGAPVLLAVGRLTRQKGFDLLVDAMPAVLRRFPDSVLHIVGEGPELARLQSKVIETSLSHAVVFHGFRNDVAQLMRGADLIVAPSRWEGFSNVVLEAQAFGRPVVVADCPGGSGTLVSFTGGGVIVAADNVGALADGVLCCLARINDFDGGRIAEATARGWSVEAIVAQYEQFIAS